MTKVSDSKKKIIIIGLAFLFIILIILFIVMIAKRDNSKQDEQHIDKGKIEKIDSLFDIEDYAKPIKILGE